MRLNELGERIHLRLHHGGSLEQVEAEIIDPRIQRRAEGGTLGVRTCHGGKAAAQVASPSVPSPSVAGA